MTAEIPRIAVTMGDPAGVGPEVCLQLLANDSVREFATPVVFGDAQLLARCARQTGLPVPGRVISESEWPAKFTTIRESAVLDLPGFDAADFTPGVVSGKTGAAGYRYVERSIEAALARQVAAVATSPLNKEALRAAGVRYPGHTEIFADKTGARRACMFQYSDEVRASFVTVHVGYRDVPDLLTKERILDVIELTAEVMQRIRGTKPKIAVLGLNPHAGEHGLFGNREEENIIIPAIEAARARGIIIEGPLPPDTAFLPAKRRSTDAFICMYHDQGHIPLKALAFDTAVNTTLGLPIIRTSVDHGTACDIAWQGKANGMSLVEAVRLAAKLAGVPASRRQNEPAGETANAPVIVIIADDLSGAAELAGIAAARGFKAEVQRRFEPHSEAGVIAVDTGTRLLDEREAARVVGEVALRVVAANPVWIYKKTDSVLRGNIAAEIQAILAATGKKECRFIPANPSKGRIITGGRYLVDGVPLNETVFANDPDYPRRSAIVRNLVGPAPRIRTPDIGSVEDIRREAAKVGTSRLPAGAADFFAELLGGAAGRGTTRRIGAERSLLICGSAAAWETGRAAQMIAEGFAVMVLPEDSFAGAIDGTWLSRARDVLQSKARLMIAIGSPGNARSTAALTGTLIRAALRIIAGMTGLRIAIEGGATAMAFIQAQGWSRFDVIPEDIPGVGSLRPVGAADALLLWVKPGSYPWPAGVFA